MVISIYLAHLNPVTNAHVEIINELKNKYDVKIMPVIFLKNYKEINSRSFPFNFKIRRKMLAAVFKDSISISDHYTFYAPYWRYLPPLVSPMSWILRRQILRGVDNNYFTYTGDKFEWFVLKLYGLNPIIGKRKKLSATSVKDKMYDSANGKDTDWKKDVPPEIVQIIESNWNVIKRFSSENAMTTKIVGMKFPIDGYWTR